MNETANLHQNANNVLFQSFYKDVWRKLIPAGLTEAEADFIQDVASLEPGSNFLDIMCGYGQHSLALAKRDVQVTAIDNLPDYIDEINAIALNDGLPVKAKVQDVAETEFNEKYDAVLCMGNSFATLDYPRAIKVLTNISAALKQGGTFIINSWMIAEIAIKYFEAKSWVYVGEYKYLLDNKYLFHPTRIETDHIVIREDGEMQTLKGIDYIFTFAEIEAMLNKTGFDLVDVYATPRKKKYNFGDNKAYIVAVKR